MVSESERFRLGARRTNYLRRLMEAAAKETELFSNTPHTIRAEDMPWEDVVDGVRIKWVLSEETYPIDIGVLAHIIEIQPGKKTPKWVMSAEKAVYVIEGSGYDLHWDPVVRFEDRYVWDWVSESRRFDWHDDDLIYIPPKVIHQHVNAGNRPARLLVFMSSLYFKHGFNDVREVP